MDLSGYFDYAAATPMDEKVLVAMQPYQIRKFYNPSAAYGPAMNVKKDVDSARALIAQILGVKPLEITFTAGATEANNMVVQGVMRKFAGANIVLSAIEHDSVRGPAELYDSKECPVQPNGLIDLQKLGSLIDENTVLVSVMLANNEIGTVQPIKKVAHLLTEVKISRQKSGNKLPVYLHVDAAQAANYLDLHVHRMGADLLVINGGKIYGPKQVGVLCIKAGITLEPLVLGGGQERGVRSGTENVSGIIGMAEALEITDNMKAQETVRLKSLQDYFYSYLAQKVPKASINGSRKLRMPNNVHVTITGQDNERLLMLLDEAGFCAAVGSACSASHDEPSHVLSAIGLDSSDIKGSLRFTMGRFTTQASVTNVVDSLASLLA